MPVRVAPRSAIPNLVIRVEVSGSAFEAPLPARPVRVGSGEGADLRLEAAGVSSTQCVLETLADGRVVVKDASSGIPTFVNGIEIQQVSLRPGDVLQVGAAKIVLREEQPEPATPPAPASAPARATPPPAPAAREPAPHKAPHGHRILGPLLGLAAAAALALGLALVLGSGRDSDEAALKGRLDYALDLYREKDYVGARDVLSSLAGTTREPEQVELIERYLERTNEAIRAADAELERYWAQRLDFDLFSVPALREVFLQRHGPTLASRFDARVDEIRAAQTEWLDEQVRGAHADADPLVESGMFHAARETWLALRREAHAGVDTRPAVDDALADIDAKAEAAATALLSDARDLGTREGPEAAAGRVKGRLPAFAGTSAWHRLSQAAEAWDAEARAARTPTRPETPTPETPTPETPTVDETARKQAEEAIAAADAQAAAWKFEDALAGLDAALARAKPATYAHDVLTDRRTDLGLASEGVDALVTAITESPDRFRRIEMGPKFYVAFLRADRTSVTGSVPGGTTEYRWSTLPPARVAAVARRTQAKGAAALGLAALLREIGDAAEAEPFLFAAGEGGVDTSVLFPLIARWRGEDVPEGGYVAHEERYVTPKERERLLLLARIDDAVQRVRSRDERTWKAAADELLALGPSAREPLVAALKARRGDEIDALAKLKVFSSSRTKARLFAELERRRAHALALINDAQAWPYPNPSGQNTDEVVARVDAVREVWERPFDVIVGWSDEAREKLTALSGVDEYLVRADPRYEPSLDDLRDKVNHEIDMPSFTPDSKSKSVREYSLKVLAFNVKVPTTATLEEKSCVLAVNEYRMMMGHPAVRIEERLVRAARGHSRHMREENYFAHNVPADKHPTADNRTPGDRARAQGYGGGVGENIARGTWTGRDAFDAWFHSSGHHRNMINQGWREMGAGRSGGSWWTQLFGARGGNSLDVPDALPAPEPAFAPEPEDRSGRPRTPDRPQLPDEPPVVPPDDPGPDGEPE